MAKDEKLINDNDIQRVVIRLDRSIPRERAVRQYFDDNVRNGINRKELLIKIFEFLESYELLDLDPKRLLINREWSSNTKIKPDPPAEELIEEFIEDEEPKRLMDTSEIDPDDFLSV